MNGLTSLKGINAPQLTQYTSRSMVARKCKEFSIMSLATIYGLLGPIYALLIEKIPDVIDVPTTHDVIFRKVLLFPHLMTHRSKVPVFPHLMIHHSKVLGTSSSVDVICSKVLGISSFVDVISKAVYKLGHRSSGIFSSVKSLVTPLSYTVSSRSNRPVRIHL